MIDFSKLSRPKSSADCQRDEDQRIARQIADDLKRRSEWSRAAATAILTRDAELRYTFSGVPTFHLRGKQNDGRPIAITWFVPEHYAREQVDAIYLQLTEGAHLTVEGYWGSSKADARNRATFIAQFIQIGDGPRTP